MVAGMPGAGISAIFYLLAALAMPFVALYRASRAGSLGAGRWRLVARQVSIALGIGIGLAIGGWMLGFVIGSPIPPSEVLGAGSAAVQNAAVQVGATVGRLGIVFAALTLLLVMSSVKLASVALHWRDARRSSAGTDPR